MKLTKQEWHGKYKNRIKERDYKLLSLAYDILEENTLQGPFQLELCFYHSVYPGQI